MPLLIGRDKLGYAVSAEGVESNSESVLKDLVAVNNFATIES